MIGCLTGKIISRKPTQIIMDVNGVGYEVNISLATFEKINGLEKTTLHTHLHVREDALTLFGFSSMEEKEMFELLISVSGIGPKLAQTILSGISIEKLKYALAGGNIAAITSVPGIGKKTAERMLLDLRDKVGKLTGTVEGGLPHRVGDDAVTALGNLGFNAKAAEKAVNDILLNNPSISIEDIIKLALSQLMK